MSLRTESIARRRKAWEEETAFRPEHLDTGAEDCMDRATFAAIIRNGGVLQDTADMMTPPDGYDFVTLDTLNALLSGAFPIPDWAASAAISIHGGPVAPSGYIRSLRGDADVIPFVGRVNSVAPVSLTTRDYEQYENGAQIAPRHIVQACEDAARTPAPPQETYEPAYLLRARAEIEEEAVARLASEGTHSHGY